MDKAELAGKLGSIAQLDHDAMLAYKEAIERIDTDDHDVRNSLQEFYDDHHRHLDDIEDAVEKMGEALPAISRDIQGRTIEGMAALLSAMGTTRVLQAMRQNERLTGKAYREATSDNDFPGYPVEIRLILQRNYDDEDRHLAYIESTLNALSAVSK
jgi:demethoxyubiquinone hydroxylase (CLK1/Coq7/Cat5 family)